MTQTKATAKEVFVKHRYGKHGGQMRVEKKSGWGYKPTADAMLDKCRYMQTRFAAERYTLYNADGDDLGDYRTAYAYTTQAADQLATTNIKGRNKGMAYVYDSTINPGAGRLSDQAAQRLADRFLADLASKGYHIGGVQYAIHQNTAHTHIHLMFASNKTLQKSDLQPISRGLRSLTQQLELRREQARELTREREQARELELELEQQLTREEKW